MEHNQGGSAEPVSMMRQFAQALAMEIFPMLGDGDVKARPHEDPLRGVKEGFKGGQKEGQAMHLRERQMQQRMAMMQMMRESAVDGPEF